MKTMLLATALASAAASAYGSELVQRRNAVPGKYIVVLHDETATDVRTLTASARVERRQGIATRLAARHGGRADHVFQHAINGFVASMSERQARAMLRDPRVRFIEEDAVIRLHQTVQPNATWGLDRIDQRSRVLDSRYAYFGTGRGVNAYIIDTGILATHSEFTGRIGPGFSVIDDGQDADSDCNGHGTHVAGTIGGSTWGVAKRVTLHSIRVLGCDGLGLVSGVIVGVDWLTANHRKPAVANMSLGGGPSAALDEAVRRSIRAGVTYVIAAGNDNGNACDKSPSRVTEALVVGASTNTDSRAPFSNVGQCLDLFAPGVDITSAWSTDNHATNTISGTSMAAPHVAGVAALLLEAKPAASPGQIHQAVIDNATMNQISGSGRGSANRLLFGFDPGTKPPVDPAPIAAFKPDCNGRFCVLDASESTDNGPIVNYSWRFSDGTTSVGYVTTKKFGSDGTFDVQLTVTDAANQTATTIATVSVSSATVGSPCTDCTVQSGALIGSGRLDLPFVLDTSGQLRAWLLVPPGGSLTLQLLQRGESVWRSVARSASTAGGEGAITFNATAGEYMWRISRGYGPGTYQLWIQRPYP